MLRTMVIFSAVALSILGLLLFGPLVPLSYAGEYPERPITIISPFSPGGSDLELRIMNPFMGKSLGQPVMIENREGGGGSIGAFAVLQSRPDGYTLLFSSSTVVILTPLINRVPYTKDDFIPIASASAMYGAVVAVRAESPWKTIQEFLDHAKKNPGVLKHGVPGVGSMSHLQESAISDAAKFKGILVPFKGISEVITNLIGGHIDYAVGAPWAFLPNVKGGRIRALVMLAEKRHPDYPNVPTTVEAGIPVAPELGTAYHGFFSPKGTPPAICDKLTDAIGKTLANREIVDNMKKTGNNAEFHDRREWKPLIDKQFLLFKEIAGKIGIEKK